MSRSPHGDPALQEELIGNPSAGPKPISIEEYRSRHGKLPTPLKASSDNSQPKKTKTRAGRVVKLRKEIANLYRLANLSISKEEKHNFLNQIRTIRNKNRKSKWAGSESKKIL